MARGWIGVGFDGVLAKVVGNGITLGAPIPKMINRVKGWVREGRDVRIFTPRVSHTDERKKQLATQALQNWCREHVGVVLPITNKLEHGLIAFYDCDAVTMIKDSGMPWREYMRLHQRQSGAKKELF